MEAIREDSHIPGRGMHVMIKTSHKETYVVSGTGFLWPDAHLSYNQWCQNTKGNSKHWCKPVTWPHPFFIHHHISGKRWRSLNASSLWQHMKDRNVTEPTIRNSLPDNVISDLFLSTFRQHPKHLSSASFQIFCRMFIVLWASACVCVSICTCVLISFFLRWLFYVCMF